MRCTLETDSPLSFAMPRELQWVASRGRLSKVFTMVASMRTSSIVRGAPGLGSSRRPSTRCTTNRLRHLPTVTSTTPSFAATSLFWLPSAHARTIRALNARAWAVLRRPSTGAKVEKHANDGIETSSARLPTYRPATDPRRRPSRCRSLPGAPAELRTSEIDRGPAAAEAPYRLRA